MYKWVVSVLFFGAFALGVGVLFSEMPQPPSEEELAAEANTVEIIASNWKFDQPEYTVEAGSTMTLQLVNEQGLHGIAIEGLGIELQGANLEKEVTFDKPGEYNIVCTVLCGQGHAEMISKLIVK
jgi:cytochrome c oxidase subunit 2